MFFILRAAEFLLTKNGMSVQDIGRISEIDPKFVMMVLIVISALYMLFNITYTVFSIPSGKLSDRIGRRNVLIIGYSLFGVTCIGFALLQSISAFIILFALYGGFKALVDGTQRAYASDFVEPELRGTALGVFHTMTGIATLPASIIAGILGGYDPSATFLYGAAIGFLAAGLFVIAGRESSEEKI
jgi:MFS family permease